MKMVQPECQSAGHIQGPLCNMHQRSDLDFQGLRGMEVPEQSMLGKDNKKDRQVERSREGTGPQARRERGRDAETGQK